MNYIRLVQLLDARDHHRLGQLSQTSVRLAIGQSLVVFFVRLGRLPYAEQRSLPTADTGA